MCIRDSNGVAILDADGIAQTVDSASAAPKVAELAVTLQRGGVPYNMVVDVSLVDVGTDDESVLAFGKTPGQLHAQPVGFFRRDLARHKGLPQVVGDHVILAAHTAGAGHIGLLVQQELGVGHAAVALVAGDEPAVVGFVWIFYIVDNVADRLADRAALAGVCLLYTSAFVKITHTQRFIEVSGGNIHKAVIGRRHHKNTQSQGDGPTQNKMCIRDRKQIPLPTASAATSDNTRPLSDAADER